MADDSPAIPLAAAIRDLRSELLEALLEGAGQDLRFRLRPVELDLSVTVTRSMDGKGGIKFWVVELGGGAKQDNGATHRLKLVLEPIGRDGREFEVSDDMSPNPSAGVTIDHDRP